MILPYSVFLQWNISKISIMLMILLYLLFKIHFWFWFWFDGNWCICKNETWQQTDCFGYLLMGKCNLINCCGSKKSQEKLWDSLEMLKQKYMIDDTSGTWHTTTLIFNTNIIIDHCVDKLCWNFNSDWYLWLSFLGGKMTCIKNHGKMCILNWEALGI